MLAEAVLLTIRQHQLIPPASRIVIAVSGGADSLALLHILKHLAGQIPCELHAATFDHGLRGEESAQDAEFVRQTAGIPVTVGYGRLNPYSNNMEARAREARYAFLVDTARAVGASIIMTAHHADDQTETVLLHLLRGSSTRGLAGMRWKTPVANAPDLTLIRPLLNITRAEIEAYCHEHGLSPRHDSTNDDLHYLRNNIRLELLPRLRQINPQIVTSLNRLTETAALENDYLEEHLRQQTANAIKESEGRVSIQLDVFRALHPALQRRCLYNMISYLNRNTQSTTYEHLLEAVETGMKGGTGAVTTLPGRLRARVDYTTFLIESIDAPHDASMFLLAPGTEIGLDLSGKNPLPGGWLLTFHQEPPSLYNALLRIPDAASLSIRTRRAGDTFAPPGLGGHRQKLKKWLIDHKVPQNIRDSLPLLVINGEIATILLAEQWIVGHDFKYYENSVTLGERYIAVTVAKIEESSYS